VEEKDQDAVRRSMLSDYDALKKFIDQINDYHESMERMPLRDRHVPFWRK
jgi:hypothetical protein